MEVNKIDIGKNITDGLASRAEFLKDVGKDIAEGSIFGAVQDISEDAVNNFGKGAQAGIVLGKDVAENFGKGAQAGIVLGKDVAENFGKGVQAGMVFGKDAAENFGAASKTGFNLGQELDNYALDIINKEKDE